MLLAVHFNLTAQKPKFPVFDDQRIPKPAGLPQFGPGDFVIDLKRLDLYPDGCLLGSREALVKLGQFLAADPEGVNLWRAETSNVAEILNRWDFNRVGFGAERYVKCIGQLRELSLVYLFTGHRELGMFIRDHQLQIAALPFEFWVHAELRGYNPEKPMGGLETAALCLTVSSTLSATPDLYSSDQKTAIETALRTKGLQPCLNWLEKPRANNWTAVVCNGTYAAAKYFNDHKSMDLAVREISNYLSNTVEPDGSYGEGMGYFNYPVTALLPALLIMTPEERSKAFPSEGLRNSAAWKVYPYLYATDSGGMVSSTLIHFGDNSFAGPANGTADLMLALLYQDPLASWLLEKFNSSDSLTEKLLRFSFTEGVPVAKSPEDLDLPLVKTFSNGDCFIRSTWEENGIVLGMRSGDGSRAKFAHQRPELGSIGLGAYGEYLVVSPGSASYRSPLHYQWDKTTRAANTITIDDQNQLFPGDGRSSWNTTDVSGFWQSGMPEAKIVFCQKGVFADVLVNELSKAYHVPMKQVRRSVLFIRDPGYFVIIDKIESAGSRHTYSWRLHSNNRDGAGELRTVSPNHWHFSRPLANLEIFLFSNQDVNTKIGEGYMHGTGRDYSPGGIYEGKPGSSVELKAENAAKTGSLIYYSVLIPHKKGNPVTEVHFSGNRVSAGSDVITLSDGECRIERNGQEERFRLW